MEEAKGRKEENNPKKPNKHKESKKNRLKEAKD